MKKIVFLFLMALLCLGGYAQIVDPLLSEEMDRRNDEEAIKVIVIMKSHYDRAELNRRANYFVTRAERREFVVNELKAFATASQYDLRHVLAEMQGNGMTSEPTILWMANALSFEANKSAIRSLAQRNDIEIIGYAIERNWIPDGELASPASASREITQNVTQVKADQVWALGYTGEGVVVAVVDTGVNYNHLDLADHLWDGGTEFPHHGYDVYNGDDDPIDDHGHGTHCSGTVCGDGTAGSQTGMAPNATLMCVKCINSQGSGGADMISAGMQWAVDHGCDMFSMSLGVASSSVAERTLLRNTCIAALDAGIVGAIAAGNEGNNTWQYPIPNNVRVPGSCPPPYMDAVQGENPGDLSCSVCIGAVDYNDNAANFTSRGPVTWSNTEFGDYPYNPGIGLIRPDVCAPGVDIKSANYASNNGYTLMSGTSMATPCVAGCMALMLSKDINLSPAEICRILEETALPLTEGKSNTYGFGRVNVLDAVEAIQLGAIKYNSYAINDPLGNNNHKLNPGESVTMDLVLDNITDAPVSNVSVMMSTENEHVNITDNTAEFLAFAANQTLIIADAFAFTVDDQVLANERIRFSVAVTVDGEVTGNFNFNVPVYDYLLQYGATVVLNDDDGLLDPGETADLRILVDNSGNEMAQMVVGILSTNYEYVTLNENEKSYSTIGAGIMGYADYNVTLDAAVPEDFVIPFTLDLVDAYGRHTVLNFNYKNACNIIFSLHDSYGDGWQGNYLTVTYSDGTPTEQMTVNSGNSATYTRELASGSTISLTWHNGQWTQECSFEITYEDGSVIYQNAGGFSGTRSFTINCGGGSGAPEFCPPVRNLAYEMEGQDVALTWEAPESGIPSGYEVYRETVLLDVVEGLNYTDPNVPEGLYNYCVYAVYNGCQSEFACTEVEVSLCGEVQNLSYTLNDDLMLSLSWEAPEDPMGLVEYQVYMDNELQTTTIEQIYAFTITEGEHDVYVKAVFQNCEKDAHIAVCVVGAVQNLDCKIEGNQAQVTWDALEGVNEYEVYVDGVLVATVAETTYTFEAEPGMVTVMVKAVAESCYVLGASAEACFVEAVTGLEFVSNGVNNRFYWQWNNPVDVERFHVEYNGHDMELLPSPTGSTSLLMTDMIIGENTICVTAQSIYGCDAETVCLSQNICAAVDSLDYHFNGDWVMVTWVGDADAYEVIVDGAEPVIVETNTYMGTLMGSQIVQVIPVHEDCLSLVAICFIESIYNIAPDIRITDVREGTIATAWNVVDGAIAYNLYRNGELIAENLTGTAYTDTEMTLNAQHCYAVQSVFEKGVSDLGQAACADYFSGVGEYDGHVSIFPNPTSDKVTVRCEGMTQIEVYSSLGKLVKSLKVEDEAIQIEGLNSGVYTLRICRGEEVMVRKIVKM